MGFLIGFSSLKIAQDFGYGYFLRDNSELIEKLDSLPHETTEQIPLDRFEKLANVRSIAKIYLEADDVKVILPGKNRRVARGIFKRPDSATTEINQSSVAALKTSVLREFKLPTDTPFRISDAKGITYLDDTNREDLEELAASTRHNRKLYFKLPLDGPRFHWRFKDRQRFLAGKLDLCISNPNESPFVINVFEYGKISDGWHPLSEPREGVTPNSPIYFGFKSSKKFDVCTGDRVEVRFENPNDLDGTGADMQGIFKAGKFSSTSSLKFYFLTGDKADTAYLSDWSEKWPLQITAQTGWSAETEDKTEESEK